MSIETYDAWQPIEGLPKELFVEAVHDDWEGTRVLLRPNDPTGSMIRIKFESAIGYRNINESFRLRTKRPSSIFVTVKDSEWMTWLIAEAGGALDRAQLTHYAIYTSEDCIDVVTEFPPIVEVLNP